MSRAEIIRARLEANTSRGRKMRAHMVARGATQEELALWDSTSIVPSWFFLYIFEEATGRYVRNEEHR